MRPPLPLLAALLALGAFAPGPAHAAPECTVGAHEVPLHAARDGTPFVVLVDLSPCAGAHELRAWLGNATHQASRAWNGQAWTSSSGYLDLTGLSIDGDGRTVVALQARPDATHGPLLVQQATTAGVFVRLRGPAGTSDTFHLGDLTLGDATARGWFPASGPWVALRSPQGALLASAPNGFDADGLPLPRGFARLAAPPGVSVAGAPPFVPGDLLVTRFAPALAPGSADLIEVHNAGPVPFPLHGLRIEDGEGVLHTALLPDLPALLAPGASITFLSAPLGGTAAAAHTSVWNDTQTRGPFALAKDGDTIALNYGDLWLDVVAYGSGADAPAGWTGPAVEAARIEGRILARHSVDGRPIDTDSAADWTRPRVHRQHQADRPAGDHLADEVRAFVCPDRCYEEARLRIDGAARSLDINLYDLSHRPVVDALANAAQRGVAVRVLLDPRPVGASDDKMDRIAWTVDTLNHAGADVRVHNRLRFDYDHAKYLVADDEWTFVVSENANPSGWPTDGASGNRGWGLAVRAPTLAQWTREMFSADFGHPADARAVTGRDLAPDAQAPYWAPAAPPVPGARPTLVVAGPVPVRPAAAPDHLHDPAAHPIIHAIDAAAHTVRLQQLNLPLDWNRPGYSAVSPLVEALVAATARGVDVHGVLAAAFEDGNISNSGNDRTAATLSALSARFDVRLGDGPHPDGIVHNKGWILDDTVIVGSANGNLASQTANREFDLIVHDARVAAYFAAVFDADHAAAPSATAVPGAPAALPGPSIALVLVVLAGLCRSVLIPRRAGRSHP